MPRHHKGGGSNRNQHLRRHDYPDTVRLRKLGQQALPRGLALHWRTLVMGCWRWLAPLLIGGILLRGLM